MDDKKGLKLKDHDLKFLLREIKHSCIIDEIRANSEEKSYQVLKISFYA